MTCPLSTGAVPEGRCLFCGQPQVPHPAHGGAKHWLACADCGGAGRCDGQHKGRATASACASQEGTLCVRQVPGSWWTLGTWSEHCSHPRSGVWRGGEILFILQQNTGVGLAVIGR